MKPRWEIEGEYDCWAWTGYVNSRGTPVVRTAKTNTTARRVVWERERGPIPDGYELVSVCRNQVCVRVSHHDLQPKGLQGGRRKRKLDRVTASRIRVLVRNGVPEVEFAEMFGVSRWTIHNIVQGTHWTSRPEPKAHRRLRSSSHS